MNLQNLSVFPSIGMRSEENQIFSIHSHFHNTVPELNHNLFFFCFINENGRRINLSIKSVEFSSDQNCGTHDQERKLIISASADLPNDLINNTKDRVFDLVFFYGSLEIGRQKNAYQIFDSIAVLIHGFLAFPQTFTQLVTLSDTRIHYLIFDYESQNNEASIRIIPLFNAFIDRELNQKGYFGRFDIVCHSMGAQISRLWMLNYPNNNNVNAGRVRQWIGVAPVNHGSAGADGYMADIVADLLNRPAFAELKTNSKTTNLLDCNEKNEQENTVKYRIIIGYNGKKRRFFYVWYEKERIPNFIFALINKIGFYDGIPIPISYNGMTKAHNSIHGGYFKTYYGDGVVANCHSLLSFASTDAFEGLNHSTIIRDKRVCALVRDYLVSNPELKQNRDFEINVQREYLSH